MNYENDINKGVYTDETIKSDECVWNEARSD